MNDDIKLELELLAEQHKRDMWLHQGWMSGFRWGVLFGFSVGVLLLFALSVP